MPILEVVNVEEVCATRGLKARQGVGWAVSSPLCAAVAGVFELAPAVYRDVKTN